MLALLLLPGCITEHFAVSAPDADVRFSGKRPGETPVRHVEVLVKTKHVLFGAVPINPNVDVARAVGLEPGEALVNLRIDEGYPDGHYPFLWGLAGVLFPFWNPHAVIISGDVVRSPGPGAAADDRAPAVDPGQGAGAMLGAPVPKAATPPAPPPEPAALANGPVKAPPPGPPPITPGRWRHLHGTYAHEDAGRACAAVGAELPTRAQLKAGKDLLDQGAGDLWASESQGAEAWIFNARTGATFLKSADETFGVYCREKGS